MEERNRWRARNRLGILRVLVSFHTATTNLPGVASIVICPMGTLRKDESAGKIAPPLFISRVISGDTLEKNIAAFPGTSASYLKGTSVV